MLFCVLCGKESKKEMNCQLMGTRICSQCCFSISSGNKMIDKVRKEKGLQKEDILAKCLSCTTEK
ncbi:MAG: hypothetical protein A2539_01245 [Elusimicrobia bacterium RIFOXYD2_FULL_34_15]|nr:MAG: hypothetical protein A2539_01245 [Elusimicrobia bacterium RIFOXYD2_FULL_34_15]